jgi:tetratricopeptide (TPR) repeat protein
MNQHDLSHLQQALASVRAGQPAQAGSLLMRMSPAAQQHPDSLYVAALAADGMGQSDAAEAYFRAAIARSPGNAAYHNGHGLFLKRQERFVEAVAALEQAVAVQPNHGEAWLNLALIHLECLSNDAAERALAQAQRLLPDHPSLLAAQAALAQDQGKALAARTILQRAVALRPTDDEARLRLARALSQQGDYDASLAALAAAPLADQNPALAAQRGDTLVDSGRLDEAVAVYRAILQRWPDYHPVLNALAFLLPQTTAACGLDRAAQRELALAPFDAALSDSASVELWQSAIDAARGLGDADRVLEWAARAETRFGLGPAWRVARLTGLRLGGQFETALAEARLEQARFPDIGAFANHRAWLALRQQQPGEAAMAAETAVRQMPREQTAWALLATAWRLLDHPRADWLLDHDRLVLTAALAAPRGWGDLASFLADLTETLERRHHMLAAPPEQTLRGGTQTQGNLFASTDPVLLAFRDALRRTVETALSGLRPDADHPFLGRLTGRVRFSGSWSVRLAGQGFHVNHVHPMGWLSSAFYVSLPPEVGMNGDAGKLVFGVPDEMLGLNMTPARIVTPIAGQLVIFPSYAWHGTVPFQSTTPRLTAAFDALPV